MVFRGGPIALFAPRLASPFCSRRYSRLSLFVRQDATLFCPLERFGPDCMLPPYFCVPGVLRPATSVRCVPSVRKSLSLSPSTTSQRLITVLRFLRVIGSLRLPKHDWVCLSFTFIFPSCGVSLIFHFPKTVVVFFSRLWAPELESGHFLACPTAFVLTVRQQGSYILKARHPVTRPRRPLLVLVAPGLLEYPFLR